MNYRSYFFHFSLIALLCSCYHEKEIEKPLNLIQQDKMAKVIADFTILEATMNTVAANRTLVDSTLKVNLFLDNQISSQQFSESMIYYTKKPEEMKLIQEKAIEIVLQTKNKK